MLCNSFYIVSLKFRDLQVPKEDHPRKVMFQKQTVFIASPTPLFPIVLVLRIISAQCQIKCKAEKHKHRNSPGRCGSVGWVLHKVNVCGLIPGQSACPGCRHSTWSGNGGEKTDRCFSLFLSLPSQLWEKTKQNTEIVTYSMFTQMQSMGII